MSRRYAIANAADAGTGLTVENGGVLVTTDADALDINRTIRGTISQTTYTSSVEMILYGTAASIANRVSFGIVTGSASLSTYVGGDGLGIGYRVGEGQIHTAGGSVASVATGALGDTFQILVVFDDVGGATVSFKRNGTVLASVDLSSAMIGEPLYWAVSLGSAVAGDIKAQINSGNRQAEYPDVAATGWWESVPVPESPRIASMHYLSHHDDDFPASRWETGITNKSGGDTRGVNFWWWGTEQQVQGSLLTIEVTDPDGRLDRLLSGTIRDQPLTLRSVEKFQPLSSATDLGTYYIDRVEVVSDIAKRVIARDVISLLDLPLQTRFIRPDADEQAANRAWPVCVGKALSVQPPLLDADDAVSNPSPEFGLDSQGVEQLGKVRVRGQPLDSGIPDFYLITGGQVLQLVVTPDGVLTLDMSKTGANYTPDSPVDAIGGDGNPFADGGGGAITNWNRYEDQPALLVDHFPYWTAPDRVAFPQEYYARSHISHQTADLVAGTRYKFTYTVHSMQAVTYTGGTAYVGLGYGGGLAGAYSVVTNLETLPKTVSGTFLCGVTHKALAFYEGNAVSGGFPAVISGLTFIELPPLDDGGDDDSVEFALPALTLEEGMRMVIEDIAGMDSSVWDSTTAAAIDLETGYTGGNYYSGDQVTRREAIEAMLAGYTASVYRARDGRLAVARAVLPEEVGESAYSFTLTQADMLSEMLPIRDDARGLSRRMGLRRNERILTDADVDTAGSGVTLRLRAKFARRHRQVASSAGPLAPGYEHAETAEILDTRLMYIADAQPEIDFSARAYAIGRSFYRVRIPLDDDIDVMSVGTVAYNRYGMQDGIPMVVAQITEDRVNDTMDLLLWGPSPYEDF